MRRQKSKEINIFSMSALDLFASALGAFILITIVVLPYYLNTTRINNNFFIVTMGWESNYKNKEGKRLGQDIDLHIIDPYGNEYSYKKRKFSNSVASLTLDSVNVPNGNEIWTDEGVGLKDEDQTWEIIYYGYSISGGEVKVEGSLYTSLGSYKFPIKYIKNKEKINIATVTITKNGKLDVKTH